MIKHSSLLLAAFLAFGLSPSLQAQTAVASPVQQQSTIKSGDGVSQVSVTLTPAPDNPTTPKMGDWMSFNGEITNTGDQPISGLVGWISLVQVDAGHEQPVDLEDWSAHKAEVIATLPPGGTQSSTWPMRLIKNGNYRVAISVASGDATELVSSQMLPFQIAPKPVVESVRVLPVAAGVPLILLALLLYRRRRGAAV